MRKNNKFIIITILVLLFNSLVFAKPKVALVLSGGGAKGLAEIPLIEVLEEEGIHPDMVLGTSMGSLLGALYAAGYTPKEVKDTMLGLDFVEILNDVPVYREKLAPEAFSVRTDNHAALPFNENGIGSVPGILGDQNILVTLTGLLSRVLTISDFDKFPVPYRAVAVDLCTGEPIVFDSGSIITAARSSMSLPAIWTPAVVGDGRICLDGGFRDNMPIRVARELGADFVIAMDVINETKCNAEDLVDFTSVSMQIFNVVMPNTSLDQHVLADMVFCPDLEPFSLMGFTQAQQIYEAGVKCVADRREELHKLVQKMEKMGVELRFEDPERKGAYDKLPDPVIESVKIKNVSFVKEAVLPDADEFEVVIGKKLDDETKEFLRDRLEEVRKNYHFTSLVYFSRPGKNENSVILEIQANTYKQDFNKIFLGGNNTVSFSHKEDVDHAEFHVMPDFTIGTYIAHPVEMLSHLSFGNTIQLDYSVMPGFSILNNNMKFNMDIGGGLRYGSLEPKTNITYEDRVLNEDKGAFFNTGFLFRYSDRASLKTGAEYEMDYIHSSEIYYHLVNFYFNGAYNSLGSILTDLRGIKAEFALEYSMMMNDFNDDEKYIDALYSVHGAVSQRFEVVRHWTGLGYDLNVSINHMPFELNKGYNEFGGIEGMCGFAYGTLKRDFAVAGLTYQQKLLSVAGMPIMLIAQGKCAIKDDYNPYLDSGDPDNMVFDGVDSVDFGAGIYGALKTPGGNLIVGGSFNRHGQWCVSIGFN